MNMEKLLVKNILQHPLQYKWTLQGLGMLRMYLSPNVRLHIWNSAYRVAKVSPMHTHPWDFTSHVVVGEVRQHRYEPFVGHIDGEYSEKYYRQTIKCGAGTCTLSPKETVWLFRKTLETYVEGESYREKAEEVHESMPLDGTVTIVDRSEPVGNGEDAQVLWAPSLSDEFVSAEPRKANAGEVLLITGHALETWFKSNDPVEARKEKQLEQWKAK